MFRMNRCCILDLTMKKPTSVFKFETFSAQSIQNLKKQIIYFAPPRVFNDPYDCSLPPKVLEPATQELEAYRDITLKCNNISFAVRNDLRNKSIEEIGAIVKRNAISIFEKRAKFYRETIGVCCFSQFNNDLLMWAHYGGQYKGFCLEFNTELPPFTKMTKVKYSDQMPMINAVEALQNEDYEQFMDLFCTKSKSWSYENEWRVFHKEAETQFTYEDASLKSIYFGPDIDSQSLEIICLIIQGQNPNVRFWRGKRSEEKFEVLFDEFKYTSHLDAKSKGHL